MEFNAEATREGMKKRFIDVLVRDVKNTASVGKWIETVGELTAESSVDDVAKAALNTAMKQFRGAGAGLPSWFSRCVSAVGTIIAEDEMQGLECVAALYMSTEKASPEQRMAALQQLFCVLNPTAYGFGMLGGMMGGLS